MLGRQKGRRREDPLGQERSSKTHNCNRRRFWGLGGASTEGGASQPEIGARPAESLGPAGSATTNRDGEEPGAGRLEAGMVGSFRMVGSSWHQHLG